VEPGGEQNPVGALISLADYEREARLRLDQDAFAYYAGGAADELTLRDNEAAWRRLAIMPRVLVGVGERDAGVTVLGRRRAHPLIIAPMAFQAMAHPDGESATARAAAATGTVMCVSTLASVSPEAVAHAAPLATRWFQLYVFKDRGITAELVSQAVASGYEAILVTADAPVAGVRERELRHPVRGLPVQLGDALAAGGGTLSPIAAAAQFDPDLRWADVAHMSRECPLPVLVKGVLTPGDAERALAHGARGVVVSNHGGRQLDTVPAGADALPAVVDAVGDRLDVLVDGGIRRGTDLLKALALGARAALVGRPVLWGLAVAGEDGARRVLEILLAEFDRALALAGVPDAERVGPELLAPARW
jgi:4-hydroxymandelate oxidase